MRILAAAVFLLLALAGPIVAQDLEGAQPLAPEGEPLEVARAEPKKEVFEPGEVFVTANTAYEGGDYARTWTRSPQPDISAPRPFSSLSRSISSAPAAFPGT